MALKEESAHTNKQREKEREKEKTPSEVQQAATQKGIKKKRVRQSKLGTKENTPFSLSLSVCSVVKKPGKRKEETNLHTHTHTRASIQFLSVFREEGVDAFSPKIEAIFPG